MTESNSWYGLQDIEIVEFLESQRQTETKPAICQSGRSVKEAEGRVGSHFSLSAPGGIRTPNPLNGLALSCAALHVLRHDRQHSRQCLIVANRSAFT